MHDIDPLPLAFYRRTEVVAIARDLLGRKLCSMVDGVFTSGIIVETEAYAGVLDRAAHSAGGRRTPRTEPMFSAGGIAYVFRVYGIHHLFNVVTGNEGDPTAVLVRAIEPVDGIDAMLRRRKHEKLTPSLTAGPGAAMMAMGITTKLTGCSLLGPEIWIEAGTPVKASRIVVGSRVGVAYAGDDALRPYRFSIAGNAYVSRAKGL